MIRGKQCVILVVFVTLKVAKSPLFPCFAGIKGISPSVFKSTANVEQHDEEVQKQRELKDIKPNLQPALSNKTKQHVLQ